MTMKQHDFYSIVTLVDYIGDLIPELSLMGIMHVYNRVLEWL